MTDHPAKVPIETLFRAESLPVARQPLFGQVSVVTPPTTRATLAVAMLSLAILGGAVYAIEVPQRARAIGVLMPAGGLLKVIATETGRVTDVLVQEGSQVAARQPLLAIRSDRDSSDRAPLSELQIRSLSTELELLGQARIREQALKSRRALALADQIALCRGRLATAEHEAELQARHVRLLEGRLERMATLALKGGLAREQLTEQRSSILHATAARAGLERAALEIRQELKELERRRDETRESEDLEQLRYEIERERLARQIDRAQIEAGSIVLAPAPGVVARLTATLGSTIRPGQTLMTLYRAEGPLEAWLYLPSDKAGQLEAGQAVQLMLDAYPHEMFGTLEARVAEISTIALMASDLTVPLPIDGPVFEVRASIDTRSVEALGSSWPLAPGTSFRADVLRQRYRLYQWLLRALREQAGAGVAGT